MKMSEKEKDFFKDLEVTIKKHYFGKDVNLEFDVNGKKKIIVMSFFNNCFFYFLKKALPINK